MSRFLEDALQVFETATAAPAGEGERDLGILIGADGALRVVNAAGWSPEGLAAHYGARTVYQVRHSRGGVEVRGQSAGRTCVLESRRPRVPQVHGPAYVAMAGVRALLEA